MVSVTDLVEQFGRVIFDVEGVTVETPASTSESKVTTNIGKPTTNRLYKFDICALERHQEKMKSAAHLGMAALVAMAG